MSGGNREFEEAMKRLEEIVRELEKGSFSLSESLQKFEEGLKLGKTCREILEKAEARVKTLMADESGRIEETDGPDEL